MIMLILLSPAKKQNFEITPVCPDLTQPLFLEKTQELVRQLKTKTIAELQTLMSISPALAKLNTTRFQKFDTIATQPAIFAFQGDAYQGFDAASLPQSAIAFAQEHLAILSGLYGILRPLDLIQPHRLEMSTPLVTSQSKNLYSFWGNQITDIINQRLDRQTHPTLINLASQEYFKSVHPKLLRHPLIHIEFKEQRQGKYQTIALLAKRARGKMARFIIENAIDQPEALKSFTRDCYQFNPTLSEANRWIFTRS